MQEDGAKGSNGWPSGVAVAVSPAFLPLVVRSAEPMRPIFIASPRPSCSYRQPPTYAVLQQAVWQPELTGTPEPAVSPASILWRATAQLSPMTREVGGRRDRQPEARQALMTPEVGGVSASPGLFEFGELARPFSQLRLALELFSGGGGRRGDRNPKIEQ